MLGVLFFGVVSGAILGSFISATSERIISNKSLGGRSKCLSCKKTLRWFELFPILSFISLWGRCARCKSKIPKELLLNEIALGVIIGLLFYQNSQVFDSLQLTQAIELIIKIFGVSIFYLVFLLDLKTGLIHDRVTYPGTAVALGLVTLLGASQSWDLYSHVHNNPLGAYLIQTDYLKTHLISIWWEVLVRVLLGLGLASFFALLILITKGRGMGWGDVKYSPILGILMGFPGVLVGVFLAFLSGSLISVGLILVNKKKFGSTIPFGPFLSFGGIISLLYGQTILEIYLKLLTY